MHVNTKEYNATDKPLEYNHKEDTKGGFVDTVTWGHVDTTVSTESLTTDTVEDARM